MEFALREVLDGDHEFLVELHNDPLVLRNLTNPNPVTFHSHMAWWKSIQQSSTEERLIFTVDQKRAGFTKFYRIDGHNMNCVLGADLHEEFRGKGLAKEMWSLMLDRCFNHYELHRVSLTTASYNTIAQRVYKKLGFQSEGIEVQSLFRDGEFHDQILMRILRSEYFKEGKNE